MWEIVFFNDTVQKEFRSLPMTAQAKFDRIEELIQSHGFERIGRPYVAPVTDKIWEIRLKTKDSNARGFYVTRCGKRIVVLRFFEKKTQKLPGKEVDLAKKRLKRLQTGEAEG